MKQALTIASDNAVLPRFIAATTRGFWLAITFALIIACFTVQPSGMACAQNSDTMEDHTADIEAAKQSLGKIAAAINSGDFAAAEPLMTEQGANEVAIWVTSFSMLLTDPEIGKNYPEEFDSVRAGLKEPLAEHGLALELKSLGAEAVPKTLKSPAKLKETPRSLMLARHLQ